MLPRHTKLVQQRTLSSHFINQNGPLQTYTHMIISMATLKRAITKQCSQSLTSTSHTMHGFISTIKRASNNEVRTYHYVINISSRWVNHNTSMSHTMYVVKKAWILTNWVSLLQETITKQRSKSHTMNVWVHLNGQMGPYLWTPGIWLCDTYYWF